jgi:hypothetical protein
VERKTFSQGALPYRVEAEVLFLGADLLVVLSGGDKPHIGSIAVALPRPSLADPAKISSTASVYNFVGHKDQVIAQRVSEILSAELNKHVVVVAGFHVDAISTEGIARVVENCDGLAQMILKELGVPPGSR